MIRPNVFDIRAALSAKHAQHVVLIHFPIALFLVGVGCDFASHWMKLTNAKRTVLASATYINLLAAAVSVVPVVISGILAWQWQLDGQKLRGILLLHLVLGCVSAALIAVVGAIHFRARMSETLLHAKYRLPLEFVATLMVIATGHLGGFLSGVNLAS
jgi:uncharacterized membrane protein